jgi:hypothetical protein
VLFGLRFTRTRAFALALLLLVTQQFGVLHSLAHVRLLTTATAGVATDSTAGRSAIADPVGSELPSDGLCQICLLLAALGAAALPVLLQWLAVCQPKLHPRQPAPPAAPARPGAPHQARAPPLKPART